MVKFSYFVGQITVFAVFTFCWWKLCPHFCWDICPNPFREILILFGERWSLIFCDELWNLPFWSCLIYRLSCSFTETAQFCWQNRNDLLAKSPATSATPSEETLRWSLWVWDHRHMSAGQQCGFWSWDLYGDFYGINSDYWYRIHLWFNGDLWFWPWDPGTVPQTCQRPPSSESSLPTSRRLEGMWTAQRYQREWPVGDGTFYDVGWTVAMSTIVSRQSWGPDTRTQLWRKPNTHRI